MPTSHSIDDARLHEGQRGQVVPLLALALVLFGVVALGLVRVSTTVTHRSAAQAAADAAALAGAVDGPEAASDVATANDAQVVTYVDDGGEVQVTIERRGVRATARARWEPSEPTRSPIDATRRRGSNQMGHP